MGRGLEKGRNINKTTYRPKGRKKKSAKNGHGEKGRGGGFLRSYFWLHRGGKRIADFPTKEKSK